MSTFLVGILDFSSPLSETKHFTHIFQTTFMGESLEGLLNNEEQTQKPEMEPKDKRHKWYLKSSPGFWPNILSDLCLAFPALASR